MNLFKTRYRIVEHSPNKFEAEFRRWWWLWDAVECENEGRWFNRPKIYDMKISAEGACRRHANPPKSPPPKIYPMDIK